MFRLTDKFLNRFKRRKAPFGFNGLGELVYYRTYSRKKADGTNERWWETVKRVVEGTYNMQKEHIESNGLEWNTWKAQRSAQEMYERIFNMKFLPPGRGLWAMGSEITEEKKLYAALNNCSMVSTDNLNKEGAKPFCFIMDMSMLGVGVGFDTRGAGSIIVKGPNTKRNTETYVIPDDRNGWVESLRLLIESYFHATAVVEFDYSSIRAAGEPIRGFGGESSGPGPLMEMHNSIRDVLDESIGQPISETTIVDISNFIAKCVVSGNVRRSALLSLGPHDSEEYLDLKDYTVNPHRESFGWSSNNSILGELGMDYGPISKRIMNNGEPGILWLQNTRNYGRMGEENQADMDAIGVNPCGEQPLFDKELCTLVETFPNNHDNIEDYLKTLKYAYLYAKTVTLGRTHWVETNRVMLRNRRIGCSMSGIAQFINGHGPHELIQWMQSGYDEIQRLDEEYSNWFCIPKSIKTTSIKPSGTVSLLAGATPGIHFPESRYYIRRIRLGIDSALLSPLQEAGYHIEPAFGNEKTTVVVEIPVDVGEGVRLSHDVTMWEQLEMTALAQKYWSDNQVSSTVTFDPETEGPHIEHALNLYQYQLKGISFLPRLEKGAYEQMPYEAITSEQYTEMVDGLSNLNFGRIRGEEVVAERFCDNDVCEIDFTAPAAEVVEEV